MIDAPLFCIETSTPEWSLAVVSENGLLAEKAGAEKASQAERLFTSAGELLRECKLTLERLAGFAVAAGPGSFTGLRIAASTAKTLAWVTGRPLFAAGSLKALAYGAVEFGLPVCAILDAGQDELYAACYRWEGGSTEACELLPPGALSVADLGRELERLKTFGQVICLGQGYLRRQGELHGLTGKLIFRPPGVQDRPSAASLGKLVFSSPDSYRVDPLLSFEPFYIRTGQAGLRLNI